MGRMTAGWLTRYNKHWPHESLGNLTEKIFDGKINLSLYSQTVLKNERVTLSEVTAPSLLHYQYTLSHWNRIGPLAPRVRARL